MTTLAIHSRQTITPRGVEDANVIIRNGIIIDVVENLAVGSEMEILDMGDKVLMAGVIDPHVHINEPGRTDWEGFNTATRAAISGGITSLVDMPLNSSPVTTTVKALKDKLASTNGQLHTNCGFWGGVIPGNQDEIYPLINMGVLGFKAFLTHSGIDEFPNVTENDLRKVMPIIAGNGLPLLVHCELQSELLQRLQKYLDDGWEPITEVGPGAFTFTHHSNFLAILSGLGTHWVEINAFKVKLRRVKK